MPKTSYSPLPNNILAKKLSSINSKLDTFSRELGEESTLSQLLIVPITSANRKVMSEYLTETQKQMERIQQRLERMLEKVVDNNETLLKFKHNEDLTVAHINNELSHKRLVQDINGHFSNAQI